MISSAELLKPLSDAAPCGEDLYYDPSFQELDTLLRGKAGAEFRDKDGTVKQIAAEPADWKKVYSRCLDLFERSKDLRVATTLCAAAIEIGGILELREAMVALRGLVIEAWDHVHPKLDPEDNNDPLQRINIVSALAAPVGTYQDPLEFLNKLRRVPLAQSARLGRYGLESMLKAQGVLSVREGETAPTQAQIDAAFRDTNPESLKATGAAIDDCLNAVVAIDEFLVKTAGAGNAADLDPLLQDLKRMQKTVSGYLSGGGTAALETSGNGAAAAGNGSAAAVSAGVSSVPGQINSRRDVGMAIDRICDYYAAQEPSSPVPLLLRRAKRLAEMNYLEIAQELSPDALAQLKVIFGDKEEPAS